MANPTTLRRLLEATSLPAELVEEVLGEAGTPWLLGAPDEVVAAEAVLCHPPLAPGEVRAVATPTGRVAAYRLTVVAQDRPGLLAGTAGVLAAEGLSIADAAVTVLGASRLALQRVLVTAPGAGFGDEGWGRVADRLRAVLGAGEPAAAPGWSPAGPVEVETQPQGLGRVVVTVHAPDRAGLLHAAAAWLEAQGCNVEAGHATAQGATAVDVFVVAGRVDAAAMAAALGGAAAARRHGGFWPVRVAARMAALPWRVAARALAVGRGGGPGHR